MHKNLDRSVHHRFSGRLTFLLSALGVAVGTGNIWRFPRIAAQSGSDEGAGAFLLAWIVFLVLWSIPLIMAEYALGKKYRAGVIAIFLKTVGKKYSWLGTFVAFVSTAIAFFYAVVVGWCIYYLFQSLMVPLPQTTAQALHTWESFQHSLWPLLCHAGALAIATLVMWKGISSIERINMFLIPGLLLIVIIAVIRAVTLPGSMDGLGYLFRPDWSQLGQTEVWLAALTQNAWDTGAGWGLFLTYATYMHVREGIVGNAVATGIGNNIVSLLSGIMIFGTVFAVLKTGMDMAGPEVLEVMRNSGPAATGLTFIWMPQLFEKMPLGSTLAVLFFLGLTFAGFTSLIAMLELPIRVLLDSGMKRSTAIAVAVVVIYLLGIPSATNLNILSNQDYVWGIALIISGGFIAFAIIKSKVGAVYLEVNGVPHDSNIAQWWNLEMKYFVPIAAAVLLVWWLFRSTSVLAPHHWYNPLNTFSVMTCVGQWTMVLGLSILFNRLIIRKLQI